jgi:hypothetical protein
MAESFGKRQRGEATLKRRKAKEERRAARRVQRQVSTSGPTEEDIDLPPRRNGAID